VSRNVTEILVIAVPSAITGAASFGLASAIQQRATKRVPTATTLDPRLFRELVRQPAWVGGVLTVVVGYSLQLVALAYGPLVLVQPLLVTGVLFGTLFSAMLARRRLDGQIMLGCTACVAGLATLLTLSRPSDTGGTLRELSQLIPLATVLCGIIVVCLVVAVGARSSGGVHVAALALATGVVYGLTAGLTKVVTGQLRDGGPAEVFSHPTIYVIAVIGPMGFLLSQNTFQQGMLIAPALAIISIADPLVGVAIGVFWLGEEVTMTPAVLAGEAVAAAVLAGGIVLLARRGTQIRHQFELAVREGERACAAPRWG